MSDASTGSGHDPDHDLSDCLQVQFAVVSSDSDFDDQGKTVACTGNKEEGEEGAVEAGIQDGGSDADPPLVLEQPSSPPPARQLQTSSPQAPSLGLIPEDEEGCLGNVSSRAPVLRSPSASSSTSDPDRRVPQDYCVLQENVSENVSEEHVDFLSARQQWRQMEEQVKGQVLPQPGVRVGSGVAQGGHSFLPLRSVEHPRREADLGGDGLHHATFSPCSEDSGVDELSGRSPYEEPENQVEREIRLTLEREENFRRERIQGQTRPRPSTLHPHAHPDDRRRAAPSPGTPTFSISPSPSSPRPVYHEMSANNVIILEPDSSPFPARTRPHGLPLLSPSHAPPHFNDWSPNIDPSSIIILETSNLIIRSASEFCLSSAGLGVAGGETVQESTFSSNPFFKLRSRSSMSLVEQEIRAVRQREEDWRRQRAQLQLPGTRERYDTVLVSPSLLEGLGYDRGEVPVRCVSSPSSPSRVRKMDRSTLSCDHRFPSSLSCSASSTSSTSSPAFAVSRRQSALAQRWEASLLANHSKD
ncbi:uncharacterized protein si:ch211-153l6.6 [Osmerus eperlanus]|uniref:uncharacterized protein si:ch211-153l6.6 n=1 Tax=Osmerus eperlanus TaxID=29151 RepID=UPI002E12E59F